MTKQLGLVCLTLGLLIFTADTTFAQFGPIQRSNRALGHWNGPGYHRCNPGPDSSYYNAWSQKNSFLISRTPQYLSRYGHEAFPTPIELLHSGQSAYGQPPAMVNPGVYYPTAAPMNADFVPSQRTKRDVRDAGEDRDFSIDDEGFGGNDFQAGRDDVEDRFDAEVDSMDEIDGDDGFGEPGKLEDNEAQGSPSDKLEDESASTTPGSLILPISHSRIGK